MRALISVFVLFPSFALAATPSNYSVVCTSPCSIQTVEAQGNPTTTQDLLGMLVIPSCGMV